MHDQKRCSKKYKLKIQFFTNGLLANGLTFHTVGDKSADYGGVALPFASLSPIPPEVEP